MIGSNALLLSSDGYQVQRSVRTRGAYPTAPKYFSRTMGSPTSGIKFTWSGWIKRGQIGVAQHILNGGSGSSGSEDYIHFTSTDRIALYTANGTGALIQTAAQFRDPAAWLHLVFIYDSALATAADRFKMYVNGVLQTIAAGPTYLTSSQTTYLNNSGTLLRMSSRTYAADEGLDGYWAEPRFVDGQAVLPTAFGETDSITGAWVPKKYTGTYGAQGWWLDFSDPTSLTTLGYDRSGNANNWTLTSISVTAGITYDSMLDVPLGAGGSERGNYCTWNNIAHNTVVNGSVTRADGNLSSTDAGTTYGLASFGTLAVSSGKWYWEVTLTSAGSTLASIGVVDVDQPLTSGGHIGIIYAQGGNKASGTAPFTGSGTTAYGATYTTNDVIGIALDLSAGTITFYKNGSSQGVAYSSISGNYAPAVGDGQNASQYTFVLNCGQRPFSYTPPADHKNLHTGNLPEPTIKKSAQYFDINLYTGNGAARSIVNSAAMLPDLVVIKDRLATRDWKWTDAVRGVTKAFASNSNAVETTDTNGVTAFNSNGFSLGTDAVYNTNAETFAGYQWKESASAGFDIVSYTGNGANRTIAHGLGVTPKLMIVKKRSGGLAAALVYHKNLTSAAYALNLADTGAQINNAGYFNSTDPTSSVFSIGTNSDTNSNGDPFIAYLFAEINGYSKIGGFSGNGSTDGVYINCGFKPKLILIRSTTGARDWLWYDSARGVYNPQAEGPLQPNTNGTPYSSIYLDFDILSNGFKSRTSNANLNGSGENYIFFAFAETPFKYANAR